MKKKPSGPKYRNLTVFAGVIYYQRVVGGKRIRFSCKTDDWEQAMATAQAVREAQGDRQRARRDPHRPSLR